MEVIENMMNMEPEFVYMDKKYLIGVASMVNLLDMGKPEPVLWGLFYNLDSKLKIERNAQYPRNYELEIWSEKEFSNADDYKSEGFIYMVGAEVNDLNEIPPGCIGKTLPAAQYAVFRYTGKPIYIMKAYVYIFQHWFPKSDYTMPYNYNFSYYRDCDTPHDPKGVIDICMPIQKKKVL